MATHLDSRTLPNGGAGDLAAAGWHALRAAWACDDAGEPDAAVRCRELAAELWRRAEEAGQGIAGDNDLAASLLIFTDVLRRAGLFDDARRACHRALSGRPPEPHRSLLEFELELISREDSGAHEIGEVCG